MRLYIQQLEERVRQLTGENERLTYRAQPAAAGLALPAAGGAARPARAPGQRSWCHRAEPGQQAGGRRRTSPAQSVAQDDPLIAPDGAV